MGVFNFCLRGRPKKKKVSYTKQNFYTLTVNTIYTIETYNKL